eukprot:1205979-Rhodomonas_salina.1
MCFLAVDARGACPRSLPASARIGSGTRGCLSISVERCRYAMGPGQDLPHIAGLFETSWLQLFVLNPLITAPEVAVDKETIVSIGHSYRVSPSPIVLSTALASVSASAVLCDAFSARVCWGGAQVEEGQNVQDIMRRFGASMRVASFVNVDLSQLNRPEVPTPVCTRRFKGWTAHVMLLGGCLVLVWCSTEMGRSLETVQMGRGGGTSGVRCAVLTRLWHCQWEGSLPVGTELCIVPNSCASQV